MPELKHIISNAKVTSNKIVQNIRKHFLAKLIMPFRFIGCDSFVASIN